MNVGRLGMMKDPWHLRIAGYVSGCITPGHSIRDRFDVHMASWPFQGSLESRRRQMLENHPDDPPVIPYLIFYKYLSIISGKPQALPR